MLIAIVGGIGSGKSVVSRMVRIMGYEVYDCDSRAKQLMDASDDIKNRIKSEINPECVTGGLIDRKRLAEIVFDDEVALQKLNGIVHTAVREDLKRWVSDRNGKSTGRNGVGEPVCDDNLLFVETAILYQSGLDRVVDRVWEIVAPLELRVKRVMARNSVDRKEVMARIESQSSYIPSKLHPSVIHIINDGKHPLLPQIEQLLS